MKKSINLLALLFILLCITPIFAEPEDPGVDPNPAPIDGGLTLLLAAGALYGAKKVKDSRNK